MKISEDQCRSLKIKINVTLLSYDLLHKWGGARNGLRNSTRSMSLYVWHSVWNMRAPGASVERYSGTFCIDNLATTEPGS
jgi:hypothetical protein